MRQKIIFVTDDGNEFPDEQAARVHEARVQFKAWYLKDPILDASGNPVPFANVVKWMRANQIAVFDALRSIQGAQE